MNLKHFTILMYIILIAHQIEEYIYEFWKVFPLYDMPKTIFVIFNVMVSLGAYGRDIDKMLSI